MIEEEEGVALIFAILAALILAGLAVVFMARAVAESRATHREARHEAGIHVAEAGVDDVIVDLNINQKFVTQHDGTVELFDPTDSTTSLWHKIPAATYGNEQAERAWAIQQARPTAAGGLGQCVLLDMRIGEGCGIRPVKDSGGSLELLDVVYGVSFTPDALNPTSVRVVKVGVAKGYFAPEKAILTNGTLNPFNMTICGKERDVHSNGSMTVLGQADTVTPGHNGENPPCPENASGVITSTGPFSKSGNPDIDPSSGQVAKTEDVPEITARFAYDTVADTYVRYDNTTTPATYEGQWYDLCFNSTTGVASVRPPYFELTADSTSGSGSAGTKLANPAADDQYVGLPCQHPTALWVSGGPVATFNGWTYKTGGNAGWYLGGNNAQALSGAYYAFESNVYMDGSIGANDVNLSIFAEGKGTIVHGARPDTGTGCALNGGGDGNIFVGPVKGGTIRPFIEDQLLLADRDIDLDANYGGANTPPPDAAAIRGILAAHEQIEATGTPVLTIAIVSEDACPHNNNVNPPNGAPSSTGSPVHVNSVSGNFQIYHNGGLVSPVTQVTQITAWNELRAN